MLHMDISFHESRMIALSDLCKLMLPNKLRAELTIDRVALSNSQGEELELMIHLEHNSGTVPLYKYKIGKHTTIEIPEEFRNLPNGRWVYLRLIAENESIRSPIESPHELTLYVHTSYCQRHQNPSVAEKIDVKS